VSSGSDDQDDDHPDDDDLVQFNIRVPRSAALAFKRLADRREVPVSAWALSQLLKALEEDREALRASWLDAQEALDREMQNIERLTSKRVTAHRSPDRQK
jgi:hypothetical protein